MATKNLVVRFLGRDSSLQAAFRRTRRAFRRINKATAGLRTGLGRLAIATSLVGAGLIALGVKGVNAIDRLAKFSDSTGEAVGKLQLFKAAMELGGGTFAGFQKAVEKVGKVIGKQFQNPTQETTDALKSLGVSLDSLKGLKAIDLFKRLIPLVLKLGDVGQRASGGTLFGRGFEKELAAFKGLDENLKRAKKNLKETDLLLNQGGPGAGRRIVDQAKYNKSLKTGVDAVVALKDAWQDISDIVGGFQLKLVEALGPSLAAMLNNLVTATRDWLKEMGGGQKVAETLATSIIGAIPKVVEVLGKLGELAIWVGGIVKDLFTALANFNGIQIGGERPGMSLADRVKQNTKEGKGEATTKALEFLGDLFSKNVDETQEGNRIMRGGFDALGKAL